MDYMDIDQVVDVPDTPDRLDAQNINGRDGIRKESHSSMGNHSENYDFLDEGLRNRSREKNKLTTDNGSRKLLFRPQNNVNNSDNSERHRNFTVTASGNAASSKNALSFKRMAVDKTVNHEDKHSINPQPTGKGKALSLSLSQSQLSACHGHGAVVDLTERNRQAKVYQKAIPRNSRAEEIRKGSISVNNFSSLHTAENPLSVYSNACKVKEKVVDSQKVGASFDHGKAIELVADSPPNSGKTIPTSLHPITSHRTIGQKRLVLNGCISPHNVAKAKQSAQKHSSSSVHAERDGTGTMTADGLPSLTDIRELIAETNDSHRAKGKGVITISSSSKEPDAKTMPLSSRSSTLNGKAEGTGDANGDASGCSEGLGGWRSTHNLSRKMNSPLSDEKWLLSSRKDDPCLVNEQHRNGVVKRDYKNGSDARNSNCCPKDQHSISCHDVSAPLVVQTVSHFKHQMGQSNEHQHAANSLIKRQKQRSTSSNHGECSSSAFDNSEFVFLDSPGEQSNVRSRNNHGAHSSDPVIEIDEFSPEIRNTGSHNIGRGSNVDSDVRARQLEADEMLARELQEQLYNEVPGVGVREIDEHIALALQQEESSPHAFSSGSHHVSQPRGSLMSNLHRQTQSRSSQNPSTLRGAQARVPNPTRRGAQARVPNPNRMAQLRGRFPGQSRTISSRQRNSLFPPNVDVDMRIHILEALEAFSDMGMAGGFLQVQRDFNENDYEMLLALDENNHQHGGASSAQINGLPQSTVQSDNLEECSICLETPSIGDTIRHLPCLHRFHKDCIDPWLRRRTSCPVCKSSIT